MNKSKKLNYIALGIIIALSGLAYFFFIPQTHTEKKLQETGGYLIREVSQKLSIQRWNEWVYDIKYYYTPTIDEEKILLGYGFFHNRKPSGDTELIKLNDWYMLKSGMGNDTDIILYGKLDNKNWGELRFTPYEIEEDTLWTAFNIPSLQSKGYQYKGLSPAKASIEKIEGQKVYVYYEFPIDKQKPNLLDRRRLIYDIQIEENYLDKKLVRIESIIN